MSDAMSDVIVKRDGQLFLCLYIAVRAHCNPLDIFIHIYIHKGMYMYA